MYAYTYKKDIYKNLHNNNIHNNPNLEITQMSRSSKMDK